MKLLRIFESTTDEKVALRDAQSAVIYAAEVVKGKWPKGEKVIATNAQYAYEYASEVLHGRFPLGEKTIATSAAYSYSYARDVIKGRWSEGEKAILSNGISSAFYALNVIKGRWPEGEMSIAKNGNCWLNYIELINNELSTDDKKNIINQYVHILGEHFYNKMCKIFYPNKQQCAKMIRFGNISREESE